MLLRDFVKLVLNQIPLGVGLVILLNGLGFKKWDCLVFDLVRGNQIFCTPLVLMCFSSNVL